MNDIAVKEPQLRELAQSLYEAAGGIGRELDILAGCCTELSGQWTGEAADAFQFAESQWQRQMAELKAVLAEIGVNVSQTADLYADVESRIEELWTE